VQYFINTSIASTVSDDYSCEVDVTCLVKKQCNGLHECSITVDDNLFSDDLCDLDCQTIYISNINVLIL
jgi:hypothetical protein